MLLGVQAVGPKVALAALSAGRPRELLAALAAGDAARCQAVPGTGKRTAARISVELREKVADGAAAAAGPEEIQARRGEEQHPRGLARAGLIELGYGPAQADELLRDVQAEAPEELIAAALRPARSAGGARERPARAGPDALPRRRGRARSLARPPPGRRGPPRR